jgi:hypothetical protein
MGSSDLVAETKSGGCEGVWEICWDSGFAYYWVVWFVLFDFRLNRAHVYRYDYGLHQASSVEERAYS